MQVRKSIEARLISKLPPYLNDVPDVVRAFNPYVIINDTASGFFEMECQDIEGGFTFKLTNENGVVIDEFYAIEEEDFLKYKKLTKRFVKTLLYKYFSSALKVNLPYGSLTGVRPTKLMYELGANVDVEKYMQDEFFVSAERAQLIHDVIINQKGIYNHDPKGIDIFVNIPFCPTRCAYCSFISTEIGRVRKRIPEYIECVKQEILDIKKEIEQNEYKVRSIYVGGGTPTSLEAEELSDMLAELSEFNCEFTVEAGRPDSITRAKLDALKALNVTRISINPQTFKESTLKELGRNHTVEEIYSAYKMAQEYNFDINMDLIAGLNGETYEDFVHSVESAIALDPDNITVHTLSIKRGGVLKQEGGTKRMDGSVRQMADYARNRLQAQGLTPYYMYRQKNMADNLENVAFCKSGKQCIYNIDYMEETNTILSAGAGAMSKYVFPSENRLERACNPKGFNEYIARCKK
ncbi:MAG: coproporphyrinogen dehydrogenase HemZ [Bacillota bacterium]